MYSVKPILGGLVFFLAVTAAAAEYRTVLVRLKHDPEKKTSVSIDSDEKKERRSAASVAEAAKVIAGMEGWGSTVGVYVVSDQDVPRADLKELLRRIRDNPWLELKASGRDLPKEVGDQSGKSAGPGPRRPAPAEGKYVAYWLAPHPAGANEAEYPVLLLARLPMDELAEHVTLLGLLKKKSEQQPPLLEAPALAVVTYKKDSIWNADGVPFKPVRSVADLRPDVRKVTVNGTAYRYEACPVKEVVRLLERPEGTVHIHRIHSPLAGARQTARALLLLLKEQLASGEANPSRESSPPPDGRGR